MAVSTDFSPLSVAALNRLVRQCIEGSIPLCWVAGEISNLTVAASGHAYFTLKDESAQVRCVMFRNRNQLLGWKPANGQHVEARVLATLYEARGDFQLNVETMRLAGAGNLFERFQRLKARLAAEGLFATEDKRPLPSFPRRIGLVTSPQAAALRDVLSTLSRRAPHVEIVLFPTQVQGDGAAEQIATAIAQASAGGYCDTLILCRGGGSMEDLWAFNEEIVARAIRACRIPVISGIGHETDFTIADFAADLRAPTPTAAAEIAAPETRVLQRHLDKLHDTLHREMARLLAQRAMTLDVLARRLSHPAERLRHQREALHHLARRLGAAALRHQGLAEARLAALGRHLLLARPRTAAQRQRVDRLAGRLAAAGERGLAQREAALKRLAGSLEHLNPQAVLARGYAVVRDRAGRLVTDAGTVEPSASIRVYLARGRLDAEITGIDEGD